MSSFQREWLDAVSEDGWLVAVCRSLDEFTATTMLYITRQYGGTEVALWRPARRTSQNAHEIQSDAGV